MNTRHVLHRDIESRSTLDLTEVGAWRYASDPNTGVWCIAYAVNDAPAQIWIPGQPIPEEFGVAAHDADWLIVAHNDAFERAVEELILAPRYGWPIVPIQQHVCTMAMALASALPGSLDGAAEALNSPFRKDAEGQRLMRKMARPRKPRAGEDPNGLYWHDEPENQTRLQQYCMRDTDAERWLYQHVSPLTDSEQALWALDAVVNQRGFHTDGALLEAASRIAATASQAVQEELARITAGALTSTDQVAALLAWLAEHGCEVNNLRKPTLRHALRRRELDPVARRVIELRLGAAHAAAAKIDTLLAWRDIDGRVRGTLRYHGAGTGRWTGHGPQPQNFKRDSDGIDAKLAAIATGDLAYVAEHYSQPLEVVGDIARAMICATPGHRLLIGDFSGIESRVLAWVSGQQSKLEQWAKFDRTGDPKDEPYYLLGRSCGRPEESARSIGKTADLAFGYMGGPGAWDRLAPDDDTSTQDDKRRYQKTWRRLHPQAVQFWGGINRAAICAVRKPGTAFNCRRLTAISDGKTFLQISLPSGRSLSYPSPRLATDKFSNAMVMFKDNAAGKWIDCRYGQGAYGGLWTENIVQAIARDLLAAAMMLLEAAGYHIVLHVHDEIVCEAQIEFGSTQEFRNLITTLPGWAAGLPIAAKVRNGERFSKSEKPAPAPTPQTDYHDEINAGLKREGIEPINWAASSARCPDSGGPEITHQRPFVSVEPEAKHDPSVEISENSNDSENLDTTDASPKTNGARHAGNRFDADEDGYKSGEAPRGAATGRYIYKDAQGLLFMRVIRTSSKSFPTQHWQNGRWVNGWPPGPVIPYRLPELLAAPVSEPVWICEGEKDTDNVAALGLIATTNPGGAKVFQPELAQWFKGKELAYVLEDNDDAGREHTRKVLATLHGIVPSITVIAFPELPDKGDVSDWFDAGGNLKLLLARAEQARQRAKTSRAYVTSNLSTVKPRAVRWVWPGHLARGGLELIAGTPEIGKSQIHCQYIACATTGRDWPNGVPGIIPCRVVLLTAEDTIEDTLVPRLKAAKADLKLIEELKAIRRNNRDEMFLLGEDLDTLEQMIRDFGDVGLVTIDPITAYMGHAKHFDSHRATDVRSQLSPLKKLAEQTGVAFSAITHPPKNASPRALDHFIGSQAFIAAARIGHLCVAEMEEGENGAKRETGRRFFTNPKINIEARQPTLIYQIDVVDIGFDEDSGMVIKAPVVRWEGESELTAEEALAASRPTKGNKAPSAKDFLADILISGPVLQTTIVERGAERGFSYTQLWRAKAALGVEDFKEKGVQQGPSYWALPQHVPR